MTVRQLSLTEFRCYQAAVLQPGDSFIVLTGENGAGKTNILEAVSLLSPGRGLRLAKLSAMAREEGEGGFAISAEINAEGGIVTVGTGTAARAPERRLVRVNGATASATTLTQWLSILWLTPAMDRLFVDAPAGRRRFLDRFTLALEPGHAREASRYDAAMRARNRLLGEEGPFDTDWCTALEAQMADHGSVVAGARERTIDALNTVLAGQPEGDFAGARVALTGDRFGADYRERLARERPRDRAAGRSLSGPHRSDIEVIDTGKQRPAQSCSTGEQKALLLAMVLAHADLVAERAGRRPLILLDEVAAHLDARRRAALFERLADRGGQVWMTGTDRALFDGIPAESSHFSVCDGSIEAG
jgi:DNA replication and repair protein RecF